MEQIIISKEYSMASLTLLVRFVVYPITIPGMEALISFHILEKVISAITKIRE